MFVAIAIALAAPSAFAEGEDAPAADVSYGEVQLHGFVSEGAFVTTSNEYIGSSSDGSLKLFEAGFNLSSEVADRLRVGLQVYARDFGALEDLPRLDWAFLDYRWRSELGFRAGIIKMPFGLYNEYTDVDSARVSILMPQSMYSFVNRDVLLSHRGFALYGNHSMCAAGALEYQAWLGTLNIPENALTVLGATLDSYDVKYVTGAQLFWRTPLEGLRVGATYLRTSIDFSLTFTQASIDTLVMAGLVPADYDGKLVLSDRPITWIAGSTEFQRGPWLFAAEYSRAFTRVRTTPSIIPTTNRDSEKFYGLATYRVSPSFELGTYYSVNHLDADDRRGHDPKYKENHNAYQRDLAATIRWDVNESWLWKLEGHFIDGTADLPVVRNPNPERYWGLFLVRTTVTF